jgi:hypothetical protein
MQRKALPTEPMIIGRQSDDYLEGGGVLEVHRILQCLPVSLDKRIPDRLQGLGGDIALQQYLPVAKGWGLTILLFKPVQFNDVGSLVLLFEHPRFREVGPEQLKLKLPYGFPDNYIFFLNQ